MQQRQAAWRKRLGKIAPQIAYLEAIRDELPEDGIFVEDITQMVFAARLAYPVYKPRTLYLAGLSGPAGLGFATALGAQHARPDVPVVAISGDGGFMFTATEMATAMRHRIPLVTVVFNDGAYGNVRRIQKERYGNRLIGSDLLNPDLSPSAKVSAPRQSGCAPRRTYAGAASRLCPPRRTDPDRSAGGASAQPMGVHPFGPSARLPLPTRHHDKRTRFRYQIHNAADHHNVRACRRLPEWLPSPSSPSIPNFSARRLFPLLLPGRHRWPRRTRPWSSMHWPPASTSRRSSSSWPTKR